MAITNTAAIDILQFGHFQDTATVTVTGQLTADELIPLLGSPERAVWIDAVYVRATTAGNLNSSSSVSDLQLRIKKAPAGTAMTAAAGTGGTVLGTQDLYTITHDTWTAITLTDTGTTLKLDTGDLLYAAVDETANAEVTDLTVYVRFHSDATS